MCASPLPEESWGLSAGPPAPLSLSGPPGGSWLRPQQWAEAGPLGPCKYRPGPWRTLCPLRAEPLREAKSAAGAGVPLERQDGVPGAAPGGQPRSARGCGPLASRPARSEGGGTARRRGPSQLCACGCLAWGGILRPQKVSGKEISVSAGSTRKQRPEEFPSSEITPQGGRLAPARRLVLHILDRRWGVFGACSCGA